MLPGTDLLAAMGRYNEELGKAGVLLAGGGLQPSATGKRIRFAGGRRMVVEGPFSEPEQLVAGYWIWQVRSIDEAVEWARRCPDPMPGEEAELEIRPLLEAEDFGDALTPELREQEERVWQEIEQRQQKS
jgi:hypothetical protein